MKVLLINGGPHEHGCTYTALCAVSEALNNNGIETEILFIGASPVRGCAACGGCAKTERRCVFDDDICNRIIEKAEGADGFVFGSPVHYASAAGAMTAVLDRAFYAGSAAFAFKPGAAIVSCRRAGSTAALDRLNKYFTINNMPVVSAGYWNMVHGTTPDEVREDKEGMQVCRTIGNNMAWLISAIESGKKCGVAHPVPEKKERTNFIR